MSGPSGPKNQLDEVELERGIDTRPEGSQVPSAGHGASPRQDDLPLRIAAKTSTSHDFSPASAGAKNQTETSLSHDQTAMGLSAAPNAGGILENAVNEDQFMRYAERERSEHLARRAAGVDFTEDAAVSNEIPPPDQNVVKHELAEPGSDLMLAGKDKVAPKAHQEHAEYSEKEPSVEVSQSDPQNDVPDAPQGTTETTGSEIQHIMDQFQSGMSGQDVDEIMTPRLERQHPVLVLPPRSSSLEARDSFTHSPQTTGQSSTSPLSPQSTGKASFAIRSRGMSDDQESIKSAKASSIYQPPLPSPDPDPALPFDFHRFLEQLRHRTADPVARFLRSFLSEFGKKQWMVHEQVKIISDFLEFIAKKMGQCDVWRTVSDAEFDNAREGMEKLVMNRLYSQTFSPAIPAPSANFRKGSRQGRSPADVASPHGPGRRGQHQEDVERDEVIAQKIRIYGWISEEHLDIKPVGEKGQKFLSLAQRELLKITTYRAPRDKVICVLNCCKVLFGFLKNAKEDQSADAFVPLLIYTVLKAHPEHLVSNVQYIWRFRNQEKLGGEAGYYMSSLMGAVSFIETLDRTNLTITDEDFERNVEQAVSAIAEKNRALEYEEQSHSASASGPMQLLAERDALRRPEFTPRNSIDAERSSPRKSSTQRLSEKASSNSNTNDDDTDAVAGLLRTIQKPLNSIGRIFSDDGSSSQDAGGSKRSYTPARSPARKLSPAPPTFGGRSGADNPQQRSSLEGQQGNPVTAQEAAVRQASAEAAQAQRLRIQEHKIVAETLQSMFPNLDREVIEDVVAAQEGHVGRAVDACLAMSGAG